MTTLLENYRTKTGHHFIIDDMHEAVLDDPTIATVDDAWRKFFTSTPSWLSNLLRFRNKVVGWLGFTGVDTTPDTHPETFEPGQSAGPFGVIDRTEHELLTGGDDKHFSMRISIELVREGENLVVRLGTLAHAHNPLGKAYLSFVKFPHGPIARMSTERIAAR